MSKKAEFLDAQALTFTPIDEGESLLHTQTHTHADTHTDTKVLRSQGNNTKNVHVHTLLLYYCSIRPNTLILVCFTTVFSRLEQICS